MFTGQRKSRGHWPMRSSILEQRERRLPDPGPLHLARKQDLLDLQMPDPDMSVYHADEPQPEEGEIPDESKA